MKKRIIPFILMLSLVLTLAFATQKVETSYADFDVVRTGNERIIEISVQVDGQAVEFEDQGPAIIDSRTLVPVRGVFELMGFDVDWNPEARQAILTNEYYEVILTIGSNSFITNGTSHTLDVPAQIMTGRTMLPIRAVLESVGYHVYWEAASRTVMISSSDVVRIGINFELSGPIAVFGQLTLDGVKMAINHVNESGGIHGRMIEYFVVDNNSDPAEAYAVATKLMTTYNVSAIIGPITSGNFSAAISAAMEHEVPIVSGSATRDNLIYDGTGGLSNFAFRTCFADSWQGVAMAHFAFNYKEARRAVLIVDGQIDYSLRLAASFRDTFTAIGGEIVIEEGYFTGYQHFSQTLTRINATDFDVIFMPIFYNGASQVIRQAREIGITAPILGGDGFDSPRLLEMTGSSALNNVFFSTHFSALDEEPILVDFISRFRELHGREPGSFNAIGYDAAMFVIDAIRRAGTDEPVAIRYAMANTVDFAGVSGTFSIDAKHDAIKQVFVIELEDGVPISSTRLTIE
jgi:branched-chain amino acid transport system substrate-binding protein